MRPQMGHKQHSKSVQLLVARFSARLSRSVEREIEARCRVLAAEQLAAAFARPKVSAKSAASATQAGRPEPGAWDAFSTPGPGDSRAPGSEGAAETGSAPRARRGRKPRAVPARPPLPAVDPEQAARDAELARLRALLKPARDDSPASEPSLATSSASPALPSPSQEETLHALESEIRGQVHSLGELGTARCTARIAAWTGRVRAYEEETGNRMAAQLMLDKLRALAHAMEAGHIEALTASWRTADWSAYVRKNEELAEAPATPEPEETAEEAASEAVVDASNYGAVWS